MLQLWTSNVVGPHNFFLKLIVYFNEFECYEFNSLLTYMLKTMSQIVGEINKKDYWAINYELIAIYFKRFVRVPLQTIDFTDCSKN